MADVTGALHHEFNGKSYTLRITMRGLAHLQGLHGNDLGGLLSDGGSAIPALAPSLDLISVALQRGEGLDQQGADDMADEMFTADRTLAGKVLAAAFPDAVASAGEAPAAGNGKPRAAKPKPR